MVKVKGILLSLMAILLVSGMMGVAYASFDTVSPKNHHFSHSGVDLKLIDQDELSWQDGVSATWEATDMAPGDEFAFDESFVGLSGNFPRKVEVTCDYDPWTDWEPDKMAKHMVITRAEYYNGNWRINLLNGNYGYHPDYPETPPFPAGYVSGDWEIQDADGDGKVTFYDLKHSPLTNLPLPRKGGDEETRFEMSVKFHQAAGNEFQGDTFNLTMIYTLNPGWGKGLSK